jgi:hypothetical protein
MDYGKLVRDFAFGQAGITDCMDIDPNMDMEVMSLLWQSVLESMSGEGWVFWVHTFHMLPTGALLDIEPLCSTFLG